MVPPKPTQFACPHCVENRMSSLVEESRSPCFDHVYSTWRRSVLGWAERLAGAGAGVDTEAVSQEVFLDVWRQSAMRCPRRGHAGEWLYALTTTKTAEALGAADGHAAAAAYLHLEERCGDAAEQVVDCLWLSAAMQRLPREQQAVLYLAYYQDLRQEHIADRLGLPLGTVKSHSKRAVHALRTRGMSRRLR
ncbi:sigma factor-like helix-turn-helix DNA-binding protein [Streptomyces sp. HUAS MG47]|uniref:RNA polymerase sigma factor n=1 Tax=Streptomyces solicamelliae TaxID=3231716 RepID=UPI0038779CB4